MLFGRKDPIREGLEIYRTGLNVVLRDGQIDQHELQQLNTVAAKYGLQDHHTRPLRAQAFEAQSAARLADAVLTDSEIRELNSLITVLGLTVADVPAVALAIQRMQQAPTPTPPPALGSPVTPKLSYEQMITKSALALITQDLAFCRTDWNRAWPLITKGLELVPNHPAREVFRFCEQAGNSLYAHRDVVDGALQKAIEVYELQLEITPIAIPEDAAWWEDYYKASRRHSEEMGFPPDTRPLPRIPEMRLHGLKQLCIIREKGGEIVEAMRLCDIALHNDWLGDWLIRRDKLQKKLNKATPPRTSENP